MGAWTSFGGTGAVATAAATGRRGVVMAAVVLLCGCYGYIPAEPSTITPGARVRVDLTRQGVADLPDQIPVGEDNALLGTLTRAGADQIMVRVPLGVDRQAMRAETFGQDVTVAVAEIEDLWLRRFSPVRTAIVVAGGAAAAAGLFYTFGAVANESAPGPPPEEAVRIPLFSVFVR
jgi:hypothetical protein